MAVKFRAFGWRQFLGSMDDLEGMAFTRWGDGEWACMAGHYGRNCDGHSYSTKLASRLRDCLKRLYGMVEKGEIFQRFYLGCQPLALRLLGSEITEQISFLGLRDCEWVNADVIHDAAAAGRLRELLERMEGKGNLLIGPPHLAPVAKKIGCRFLEVPRSNIFGSIDRVIEQALRDSSGLGLYGLVSVSASLPAALIVEAISRAYPALKVFDAGSVFDPLSGIKSRRYHRSIDIAKINGWEVPV